MSAEVTPELNAAIVELWRRRRVPFDHALEVEITDMLGSDDPLGRISEAINAAPEVTCTHGGHHYAEGQSYEAANG